MKHEGWSALAALGVSLTPKQIERLEAFEALLSKRGILMGVIARSDTPRIRERHVLDSIRALSLIAEDAHVLDLGSGGGLPGIPIAISRPDLSVRLTERRRRKAAFLEAAIGSLELTNASVFVGDAESVSERFDVCTARAFGSARKSWEVAEPRLVPGGRLLYWAGSGFDPSRDSPRGALVSLFVSPSLANAGPIAIMSRQ